jgi:hypothetical protein
MDEIVYSLDKTKISDDTDKYFNKVRALPLLLWERSFKEIWKTFLYLDIELTKIASLAKSSENYHKGGVNNMKKISTQLHKIRDDLRRADWVWYTHSLLLDLKRKYK